MGIFKRVFDSFAGKSGESANSSKNTFSPSTEVIVGTTELPPSVIFQPIEDPAQDTSDLLEEVIRALDNTFETACSSDTELNVPNQEAIQNEQVEASVQDLFVQIAANYAVPLKNFMFELRRGTATKDEIEVCRPLLYSVRNAVEIMKLPQMVQRISDLDAALSLGQSSVDRLLKGGIRQEILSSYEALVGIMPEAFQLHDERQRCEDILIKSLLKQIPGFGCVTLEKLYKAGLGSLNNLFLANKVDLAAATGISFRMCELICNKVAQYQKERETLSRCTAQIGWHHHLAEMVNGLRNEIYFERAPVSVQGSLESEEQRRRHDRQLYLLEIKVILAEIGELELLSQISKLSSKRRIQTLDEYLTRSKTAVSSGVR